jgi:TetR/AcrR family transcriptional regulator, cholesterol catabolism regulator
MRNMASNKPNSRKIQAEESRLRILDTALLVFAEKGFTRTTIKDIADAAGISSGLMYHYFPGKKELLSATIEHHSFLPELRRILTGQENLPGGQVLKEIAGKFLNTLDAKKSLVKILIRDVAYDPKYSDAWTKLCQEGVSLLQKYIEGCIKRGEFRPHNAEVTARSMLATIVMFHFTREVFKSSQVTRSEYIEEVFNNTLKGIEAK